MIFSYNLQGVGDTLLVVVDTAEGKDVSYENRGDVTRIFVEETDKTVGWNIFKVSTILGTLNQSGQIKPTEQQLLVLNDLLKEMKFSEVLARDNEEKIVTGFVKSCKKHPDSDHLSITQTDVGNDEVLQIVCGAPNIKPGLKVVVAKPGAMMPDGTLIWPGKLRGVESFGMICSARELHVPNAPQKRGIMELPFDTTVGEAFVVTP